jgi:alpha-galactosidase
MVGVCLGWFVAASVAHAAEPVDGSLRAWADTALLGQSADGAKAAGASLATDFPITFNLVTGKGEDIQKTPSSMLLPKWTRTHTVDKSQDSIELHTVTYTDPVTGLKVTCEIKLFRDYSAVEWVARFTNTGDKDSPIIADVRPLDMRIALPDDRATLHYAQGSSCNGHADPKTLTGYDFQPYEMPIKANTSKSFDPEGMSSTRWLPFYNLQWNGGGLIWAIGWSGRWQFDISRDANNTISLKAGQRTLATTLHPGESIRTPRMLMLSWQGDDRFRGHNQWRQLLLAHYLPRHNGQLQMTPISSCHHLWSGGGGPRANEAASMAWIDQLAAIDGEVFWLDAGWYCKGVWTESFGTWDPDPTKFPHGLKPIGEAARAKGLKFLVWFYEQNASDPTADVAQQHPEWVYNGMFDMSDVKARQWMTDFISRRISDWGIDIYRHDGGLTALTVHDTPERQGITENHAIEGWYAFWDALLAKHPGLMIDNCAGGGQNIDLETTMRSLPLWQSDVECGPPSQDIPDGLSMVQVQNAALDLYVPLHAVGCWGMDGDRYAFRSAATTGVHFCDGIIEPQFDTAQAKINSDEVKSLRDLRLGDYYPLTEINLDDSQFCGWEFYRPDLHKGFAMVFRRKNCQQTEFPLKLRGIEPNCQYRVTFVDDDKSQAMTSKELENLSLDIASRPTVIPAADRCGVVLSTTPKNSGLMLRAEDGESKNAPVRVADREAWRSVKGGMMYFTVYNRANQRGVTPKVKLTVEYFDEGKGPVRVVYDSSDKAVKVVPANPGAWKEAGHFSLTDSKTWKTYECVISDAQFDGRCNGADIRLEFNAAVAPAIASLTLNNLDRTKETLTLPPSPRSVLIVFERM